MDHDLGTHPSSSPYHQHSTLDSAAALSLQDYLASVMSPGTISAALPPASGYEAFASPPADDSNQQQQQQQNAQPVNFADILAEFTLAQSAFSPDANGNRGGGDSSAESTSPNLAPTNGNRSDKTGEDEGPAPAAQAKSAQEILLEQLKALYPAAPAPTPAANAGAEPVAAPSHHAPPRQQQHSSQVEAQPSPHSQHGSTYAQSPSSNSGHGVQLGAEMQAQLQQWLVQSMLPTNGSTMTSQTPTPTGPPAAASAHTHHHHLQPGSAGFHAPAHLQQHQQHPQHHSASPSSYPHPQSPGVAAFAHTQSAPSSLHASPMPFYAGTPHEQQQQQQQHYPGSSPATPLGHGHGHPAASSSSLHPLLPPLANMPGAAAAALAALSPFLAGPQPNSPGGGSTLQAQLNALQILVTANAQAQAHAQMHAHAHAQNQANGGGGIHGQHSEHQQATPLQQASNPQTPFDIRTSAPGTASSSYRETDVRGRSLWTRDSDPRR